MFFKKSRGLYFSICPPPGGGTSLKLIRRGKNIGSTHWLSTTKKIGMPVRIDALLYWFLANNRQANTAEGMKINGPRSNRPAITNTKNNSPEPDEKKSETESRLMIV